MVWVLLEICINDGGQIGIWGRVMEDEHWKAGM